METGGKFQLVLLLIGLIQIFTCSCSSLAFQHRDRNSWELLIGANADNEFQYDFCQYDASENIERCKNKASATVDIWKSCNCIVNDTVNTAEDLLSFTVSCNNKIVDGMKGACPQKLTVIYELGDVFNQDSSTETPTATKTQDESCSCLVWIVPFLVSLGINGLVLGVFLFKYGKKSRPDNFYQRVIHREILTNLNSISSQ